MTYGTEADNAVRALRTVMSRGFVVASATDDGDSGDSNVGCVLRCLGRHYSFLVEYDPSLLQFPLYSSYVRTIGSLWLCCGAFYV